MNIFGSLLLFFGGLLIFTLLPRIINLITRGRGGIFAGLILPALIIVVLVAGGSFYLDHNGDVVPGTLESKHEDVITYDTGIYQRSLFISVQFKPAGMAYSSTVNMNVDGALFDQLHEGQPVQVRYIDPAGLFLYSRLVQQNTLSAVASEFPWATVGPLILVISLVAIIVFGLTKPSPKKQQAIEPLEPGSEPVQPPNLRKPIAFVLFLIWLGVAFVTIFQPALASMSSGSWQTATALVKDSRHYTEIAESQRTSRTIPLIQDYDIVQFTFTPKGSTESVIGVDVVDSTPKTPQQGDELTIKYSPDDPRAVQIPGSTYTHYWKNPLGGLALSLASIFAVWLLWFMARLGLRVLLGGIGGAFARRS